MPADSPTTQARRFRKNHVFVVVTNDNRFVGVYATEEGAADEATQRGYYLQEELPDA